MAEATRQELATPIRLISTASFQALGLNRERGRRALHGGGGDQNVSPPNLARRRSTAWAALAHVGVEAHGSAAGLFNQLGQIDFGRLRASRPTGPPPPRSRRTRLLMLRPAPVIKTDFLYGGQRSSSTFVVKAR